MAAFGSIGRVRGVGSLGLHGKGAIGFQLVRLPATYYYRSNMLENTNHPVMGCDGAEIGNSQ